MTIRPRSIGRRTPDPLSAVLAAAATSLNGSSHNTGSPSYYVHYSRAPTSEELP
ncbi:hypothetical protein VTO73DRAFT_7134 [Trametes versicolor]